jgi:hypothetical protein
VTVPEVSPTWRARCQALLAVREGMGLGEFELAEHPRLMLIEGTKYSLRDNPVERVWAGLKQHIANTAPATMADRVRQTHAYFRGRTTEQTLATAAPWTSPWLPEGYGQDFWPGV